MNTSTPAQLEAINTNAPEVYVIAGPGSGKSTTLVARIRRLIEEGESPDKMVAITFTNAAARELEKKLEGGPHGPEIISDERIKLGHVGTLHSFALRMLREHGAAIGYGERLSIVSPESTEDLLWQKAQSLGYKGNIKDLMQLKAKGRPTGGRLGVPETIVASFFDDLRTAGIVDFDLILTEFLALVFSPGFTGRHEFTHLFVDEVQDSAAVDWAIYDALAMSFKFFVGDPDQNLYSFRGARVDMFIAHATATTVRNGPLPTLIRLEDNFRSHSEITEPAQALIQNNRQRVDKRTISVKGPGGKIGIIPTMNAGAEIAAVAEWIKANLDRGDTLPSEIAIIARTNKIVGDMKKTLAACGIPVAVEQRHQLPRDWAKARALVELLVQPHNDTLATFYIIANADNPAEGRRNAQETKLDANARGQTMNDAFMHFPAGCSAADAVRIMHKVGISLESRMTVSEKIKDLPADAMSIDLALAMATGEGRTEKLTTDGVRVMTIHGSKGLEFDVVFVVGCEQETIPGTRKGMTPIQLEEERRMFYVAMTRARNRLYLTFSQQRVTPWGAIQPCRASQFLGELRSV